MPSIQDIADQAIAKLDTIITNTANTVARTTEVRDGVAQTNVRLTAIEGTLQAGFANLSLGIAHLAELEKAELALAEQNRVQNDTIICLLENANELLCGMTRKMTQQIRLEEAELAFAARISGVLDRAHADHAADYDRLAALRAATEECCPPEPPPLEPCPEACRTIEYRPYPIRDVGWKPLPAPKGPATPKAATPKE